MYGYPRTEEFHGRPVVAFDPDGAVGTDPRGPAWHLSAAPSGPPEFPDVFERFVQTVDTTQVTTLLLGFAGYDGPAPATYLLDAAERFPRLQALFLGDEQDFSCIFQTDLTPVLECFPLLERLDVRGKQGWELSPFRHTALRTLRFESCCLPSDVLRAVAASDLPGLEHLDLWLGVDDGEGEVADAFDLAPILSGERLPALRSLGLENSAIQDEIAEEVAKAPVVPRLRSLSLALGTLTDRGAESLLAGQPLTHLERLDLHHHFLSDAMMERLRAALPATDVDLSAARGELHGPFDEACNLVADGRDF
ncbi:STM4015 family protein [Streptomyces sp. NPDC001633]|uniref:STM4015 family protein n=1 Tax=Streptomyces sp. NPDC001633 TaxID=3364595 RepID=UPI0036C61D1E